MARSTLVLALCALLVGGAMADLGLLESVVDAKVSGARAHISGARAHISGAREKLDASLAALFHKTPVSGARTSSYSSGSPPAASKSLSATLASSNLTILAAAAQAAGVEFAAGSTLLAPTDAAFAEFLKAFQITDAATWLAANTAVVKQLLEYHTLPQTVTLDDMTDGESLTTDLADETITVSRLQVLQKEAPYFGYNIQLVSTGGLLPVAQITKGDIETTDDVLVQIIDHILIPASILA